MVLTEGNSYEYCDEHFNEFVVDKKNIKLSFVNCTIDKLIFEMQNKLELSVENTIINESVFSTDNYRTKIIYMDSDLPKRSIVQIMLYFSKTVFDKKVSGGLKLSNTTQLRFPVEKMILSGNKIILDEIKSTPKIQKCEELKIKNITSGLYDDRFSINTEILNICCPMKHVHTSSNSVYLKGKSDSININCDFVGELYVHAENDITISGTVESCTIKTTDCSIKELECDLLKIYCDDFVFDRKTFFKCKIKRIEIYSSGNVKILFIPISNVSVFAKSLDLYCEKLGSLKLKVKYINVVNRITLVSLDAYVYGGEVTNFDMFNVSKLLQYQVPYGVKRGSPVCKKVNLIGFSI
jgi:hypothetical protein